MVLAAPVAQLALVAPVLLVVQVVLLAPVAQLALVAPVLLVVQVVLGVLDPLEDPVVQVVLVESYPHPRSPVGRS